MEDVYIFGGEEVESCFLVRFLAEGVKLLLNKMHLAGFVVLSKHVRCVVYNLPKKSQQFTRVCSIYLADIWAAANISSGDAHQ